MLSASLSAARATSRLSKPHMVERLAGHAVTAQDAVLFTVAAFSGLRLGDLRGLRWSDIDWMRRVIFVRRS